MPSDWKQQCEGFATYRWHENGAIEVKDEGFPKYDKESERGSIRAIAQQYGDSISKYSSEFDVPIAWIFGIIVVESRGDAWACAPCAKTINGKQFCSLAPNCGGGIASDGKSYSCCAYGLMQIIDKNAVTYGMEHGAKLLGNADDSLRIGIDILRKNLLGRAKGDPLVAVRMYNGCYGCKDGRAPCGGEGIFGIGGQNNYVENFARVANTFLDMGLSLPGADPATPGVEPVTIRYASMSSPWVFIAAGAAGVAAYMLTRKKL